MSETVRKIPVVDEVKQSQVFTPPEIARFMAEMNCSAKKTATILDPGSGRAILSAELAKWLMTNGCQLVHVDAYEIDPQLAIDTTGALTELTRVAEDQGASLSFQVHQTDFLEARF